MNKPEQTKSRSSISSTRELRDAKPLLQAIILGMALAAALVAAATITSSNAQEEPKEQNPVVEQLRSAPGAEERHHSTF